MDGYTVSMTPAMKRLLALILTPIITTIGFHVYLNMLMEISNTGQGAAIVLLFLMSLSYGAFCLASLVIVYLNFEDTNQED